MGSAGRHMRRDHISYVAIKVSYTLIEISVEKRKVLMIFSIYSIFDTHNGISPRPTLL